MLRLYATLFVCYFVCRLCILGVILMQVSSHHLNDPFQPAFACSKLITETVESGVKYVQS